MLIITDIDALTCEGFRKKITQISGITPFDLTLVIGTAFTIQTVNTICWQFFYALFDKHIILNPYNCSELC